MIVTDTNVLVYLMLPGQFSDQCEAVLEKDNDWRAPYLWKSEFNNVLGLYLRKNILDLEKALYILKRVELLMNSKSYHVSQQEVLKIVSRSNCSAYDCEFIALALNLSVPLITFDKRIIREFPDIAQSPETFLA